MINISIRRYKLLLKLITIPNYTIPNLKMRSVLIWNQKQLLHADYYI